jgi:hypothetical protein
MDNWRKKPLFALLAFLLVVVGVGGLPACSALDDTEKEQYLDGVVVNERALVDCKSHAVKDADGKVTGMTFDATWTAEDLERYLGLSLRERVAWGVKLGVISEEDGAKLLKDNGLDTKLGTDTQPSSG